MKYLIQLIAIVAFINFTGFLFFEDYFESTELLIIENAIAIAIWIYLVIKGERNSDS